jgi:hypothetical protein
VSKECQEKDAKLRNWETKKSPRYLKDVLHQTVISNVRPKQSHL